MCRCKALSNVAVHRLVQAVACGCDRVVELTLQQFSRRQVDHLFGDADTGFAELQELDVLLGLAGA
jgi:hypothetical protein